MSIRIEGLDELAKALTTESVLAKANGAKAVGTTAVRIERTAKELAPVDTGSLRDSIRADVSGTKAEIGPTVRYAPFVERGTWKDPPQPFMEPAADAHADDLVKELERLVGEL